jgi:hypothetical protein
VADRHRARDPGDESELARLASQKGHGVLRELWDFLRQNKKWWLIPIVVVLLLLGALVFLSTTAAAPFTYTLF